MLMFGSQSQTKYKNFFLLFEQCTFFSLSYAEPTNPVAFPVLLGFPFSEYTSFYLHLTNYFINISEYLLNFNELHNDNVLSLRQLSPLKF